MQNHPGHYNTTTIQPRGSCIFHALNAIEFSFLGNFTLFRALRLQFPTSQTQRMRRRCREYINSLEPCRTEPNLILQSLNSNRIGTSQSPKNVQISVHQEWCANRTKPNLNITTSAVTWGGMCISNSMRVVYQQCFQFVDLGRRLELLELEYFASHSHSSSELIIKNVDEKPDLY